MNWLLRTFIFTSLCTMVVSCNSDKAQECFRSAGATVNYEIPVAEFSSLKVGEGIELVIAEGDTQSVMVETGNNLKGYITANVVDGELQLTNSLSCNWVRNYNTTTITVTTPNLSKIYTATQWNIRSANTLHFENLEIKSGRYSQTASATINLDVDCNSLMIEDNQNLFCYIRGKVNNINVDFYAGNARFDGSGLTAKNAYVFHRSSNDIRVKASELVKGTVLSTGNLVLLNHPPVVEVNTAYTGKVIYE